MNVCQNRNIIQSFQQKVKTTSVILESTSSLEYILRVAAKAIEFYIEAAKAQGMVVLLGYAKLQTQLQDNIETLGFVQTFHYLHEMLCPDIKGLYFFKRYSWQKCASRIFLLCYSILTDLKLAAKFGFVQLEKIDKVAFWGLSPLRLTIKSTYIFYRFFAACEGVRTKVWWKVGVSLGKIVLTILGAVIAAQRISSVACLLAFSGVSLGLESYDTAKKIGIL